MTFAQSLWEQITAVQGAELLLRLLVAAICGGIIGFERSSRFKTAGIRTHIMVCITAALFMILSKYCFFDISILDGVKGADPARMAASFAAGVSCLCAGAIFRTGDSVHGLTTASGILATGAVGLTIGGGMYSVGVFVTILICIFQIVMHKINVGGDAFASGKVTFDVKAGSNQPQAFLAELKALGGFVNLRHTEKADGIIHYEYTIRVKHADDLDTLFKHLGDDPNVVKYSSGQFM